MCCLLAKNYTVPTMLNSLKSKFANFSKDIKLTLASVSPIDPNSKHRL